MQKLTRRQSMWTADKHTVIQNMAANHSDLQMNYTNQ
jgi:hypothetical protein